MPYTSSGSLRQAGPRRLTAASLAMTSILSRSSHLTRHVSHRQVSSPRPTPLRLASLIVGGGFKLMFHGTSKRKGVGVIVVRHFQDDDLLWHDLDWMVCSSTPQARRVPPHRAWLTSRTPPKSDTIRGMAISGLVYVNADDRLR